MNIKNLKYLKNIEKNTKKMKNGVEYLLYNGYFITTITKINKKTLTFNNYRIKRDGELEGPFKISKDI